ncbi:MAG: integrin alpha [candidate division WOR-3 bacterium]|nr:integrin alpha [candidate division WOR-3 bacterium]
METIETFNQEVLLHLGKNYLSYTPDLIYSHHIFQTNDDCFGCMPGGLGNINGDGYDDFTIVAGHAITDTMPYPARYEQFGFALDNLGDVNDDGYKEFMVGDFFLS